MEEAPRRDFSDDKHGLTSPDLCCLLPELAPPKFTIQSDDKHGCSIALFSLPDVGVTCFLMLGLLKCAVLDF
ncbi:unnamed protein product [Brassica oleracea var. botrytis]|uniref:(rape) hypothetical protein n=1 Tax=Brassica napus TaxID=3708 RepID=A0A816KFC6_BRANA|nr:unnamed protein product [Brassica napus]